MMSRSVSRFLFGLKVFFNQKPKKGSEETELSVTHTKTITAEWKTRSCFSKTHQEDFSGSLFIIG